MLVELERVRKLTAYLPNAVYELQKYWRPICVAVVFVAVTNSLKRRRGYCYSESMYIIIVKIGHSIKRTCWNL